MDRRSFLHRGALAGGALFLGPLHAIGARAAAGQAPLEAVGYGPLVLKGELWLPAEFNYQVISRQGKPMSDGRPTPGIFDGMGAFPGPGNTTILIRNHENREQPGEIKVVTGPGLEYNVTAFGGNTKMEVRRTKAENDPVTGQQLYAYEVVRDFAILGGTSTNCAGGVRSPHQWLTCEEVVKRLNGIKHGYLFEIDARADGPVPAIPVPQAGRRAHEASLELAGIIYMTEDRPKSADPLRGQIGAGFYRYTPTPRGGGVPLHLTSGPLEALAIRNVPNMDMDFALVGVPYPVEWVPIPEADHDDDTDNRRDRVPGFTPNRVQAADAGAAIFSREEGMWAGPGSWGNGAKVYFDCTDGGAPLKRGQVWEYDPGRETLTLIYVSTSRATLENPDNIVIVPQTGDIFLQEDSSNEDYVRGVTLDGEIYDFCRSQANNTEFCGGCFDPDGHTFYLNMQGGRFLPAADGTPPDPNSVGVTYAIYGPFEKRQGSRSRHMR
jgi:secreted PhoX family phosphatase